MDELPKHLLLSYNVDHKIEVVLKLTPPFKSPYWLTKKELQQFKVQINDLMEWGYIRPSKWEDETPTPKVEDLESSGTPECLKFDSRGQNTSHWGVLGVIGRVLKCRCLKCPRIGHLDI